MVRRHRMLALGFMALVLMVLLAVLITRPAAAQEATEGYRLASQWCRSCHIIEPGAGTSDVAPSFQQTADNPEKTTKHLRAWLSSPHSDMPDFNLSRLEITALVAYIESLGSE